MLTRGPIPPSVHGILDYVYGLVLIVAPFVLDFGDTPRTISVVAGVAALVVGACTDWSRGIVKLIAPQTHGLIDLLMSVALIASPFVFGFYDDDETAMAFFLVMGVGGIVIGLATRFVPDEGSVRRDERATRAA